MQTLVNTTKYIGLLAVALTVALAANLTYAQWVDPDGMPPANNPEPPINISGDYQAKLGDLGAIRMRSDEYCDATGANCWNPSSGSGPTGPGGDVVVVAGRCYAPLDNVTVDGVVRNIIAEVACDPQECQVEFVTRARNDRNTDIRTIRQTSPSGRAAVYFWQHSDDNPPGVFGTASTEMLADDAWGSSWNDRSERIRVYYMDDTKESRYGVTLRGYANRSDNHTEYGSFRLRPGETTSIVGLQDGAVSAGYAQASARVLSCVSI